MYIHNMPSRKLLLSLAFFSSLAAAIYAQTPTPTSAGPTTRILAIGHLTGGATREQIMPVMQQEVKDTVRLYLDGKVDQWFVRRDQNGVVFLLNAGTISEAKGLLDRLPLGKAKLMEFEFIPLGPLTPLALLLQGDGGVVK